MTTLTTLNRASSTSTQAAKAALNDFAIVHGVGDLDKGEACTVAAINLGLTGKLTDKPHPCMSDVIRRWVIAVQDSAPLPIIRSERWRAAAAGLVNSSAAPEVENWERADLPGTLEALCAVKAVAS